MNDYSVKIPVAASPGPGLGAAAVTPPSAATPDPVRKAGPAAEHKARKIDLEQFAKNLEQHMPEQLSATRLLIERDEASGLFVYKILDQDTREVVRQYPTEEMLRLMSGADAPEGLAIDDSI